MRAFRSGVKNSNVEELNLPKDVSGSFLGRKSDSMHTTKLPRERLDAGTNKINFQDV